MLIICKLHVFSVFWPLSNTLGKGHSAILVISLGLNHPHILSAEWYNEFISDICLIFLCKGLFYCFINKYAPTLCAFIALQYFIIYIVFTWDKKRAYDSEVLSVCLLVLKLKIFYGFLSRLNCMEPK